MIIEITNTVNGMLEQGGVCGRRVSVTDAQLAQLGIVGDLEDDYNEYYTNEEFLLEAIAAGMPVRVIRKGQEIF